MKRYFISGLFGEIYDFMLVDFWIVLHTFFVDFFECEFRGFDIASFEEKYHFFIIKGISPEMLQMQSIQIMFILVCVEEFLDDIFLESV